jgi:acetylornithine aminotransferase
LEISHAQGSYIFDINNNKYLDFIAGVSACSLGHKNPVVIEAIKNQLDKYLHVMVYGEYIQKPSLDLTMLLAEFLPKKINKTYLTNSGTEAIDGALKLARRYTGRSEIFAAKKAYHGNTIGALSVMGYEERKNPFRPLLPGIRFINFNSKNDIKKITSKTAAVILETIQGGAGFVQPINDYLNIIQKRCNEVGALLILDEIQPGFGRTGKLFGFENYNCTPDIVVFGKGLGGGMPIGGFSSSEKIMDSLSFEPMLGHITTFGGHPVIAAAALATLKEITSSNLIEKTLEKEIFIRSKLKHKLIKEIRGKGLMLCLILIESNLANELVMRAKKNGLILFWLLYEPKAVRITPPMTISFKEIEEGCNTILNILDEIQNEC